MIACRDAMPGDAAALDAMARECWIDTFAVHYAAADLAGYLSGALGPDGRLTADLMAGHAAYRIAEDGRIVGYAKLWPLRLPAPDPPPGAYELNQIYVLRRWHGTGVAQALTDWAIDTARVCGAPALYLSVWENNPRAIRYYTKLGFDHVGDYAFAVGAQIDRDLILRLML